MSYERAFNLMASNLKPSALRDGGLTLTVKGGTTGATYIIEEDSVTARGICRFCVRVDRYYHFSWPDHLLALALYIQHDERRFLKIANPRPKGLLNAVQIALLYLRAGIFTSHGALLLFSCGQMGYCAYVIIKLYLAV